MSILTEQFKTTLKSHGKSVTKARLAVFEVLSEHESLTMRELAQYVDQAIDRASIYRAISLFEKLGIVQRIQIGWKYRLELSDTFSPHHHHLHCITCGKLVSLQENENLELLINNLAATAGFKLTQHQLELAGYCRDCQQAKK
jgi:Fur family ferric uptake transcriptional regulator